MNEFVGHADQGEGESSLDSADLSYYTRSMLAGFRLRRKTEALEPRLESAIGTAFDVTSATPQQLQEQIQGIMGHSTMPLHGHGGSVNEPAINQLVAVADYVESPLETRKIEIPPHLLLQTAQLIAEASRKEIARGMNKITRRNPVSRWLNQEQDSIVSGELSERREDTRLLLAYIQDNLTPKQTE